MKRSFIYFIGLYVLFQTAYSQNSQPLYLFETIQEQNQWCWAAVSSCVIRYYGTNIEQCEAAEFARKRIKWHSFGRTNCCESADYGCNYWNYMDFYPGSIQDILKNWNIGSSSRETFLSVEEIRSNVNNGIPFIIRFGWTTGGGHFLVGYGISNDGKSVYYMNPWIGEGMKISDYSWMVKSSDHDWTHTQTINTIPVFKKVNLKLPLNFATVFNDELLRLTWFKTNGVNKYKLIVSEHDDLSSPIIYQNNILTDTTVEVTGLKEDRTYYWAVRSTEGITTDWSETRAFTIKNKNSYVTPNNENLYYLQIIPNPVNNETSFNITLTKPASMKLDLYDTFGRCLCNFFDGELIEGINPIKVNMTGFASGIYYLVIKYEQNSNQYLVVVQH